MGKLISAKEYLDNANDYVLIDCQEPENYALESVEGAITMPRTEFHNKQGCKYAIIPEDILISKLIKYGVPQDKRLAIYDNMYSYDAAYNYWLLKAAGYKDIAIIDGGLAALKLSGAKTIKNQVVEPSALNEQIKVKYSSIYVDTNDVVNRGESTILLDVRAIEEYEGKETYPGAKYKGCIENSINIPFTEFLAFGDVNLIEEVNDLKVLMQDVDKDTNIFVMCHGGVRAALVHFILQEMLGYKSVRNYVGSWAKWTYDN